MNPHADLRLLYQCCWRFSSSRIWHCVVGFIVHSGLKDYCGFFCRVMQPNKTLSLLLIRLLKVFPRHVHCIFSLLSSPLFPTVWLGYKGTCSANKYAALYVFNTAAHLFGWWWWFFLSLVGTAAFWFRPWRQNLCYLSSWSLVTPLAQLHCNAVRLHLILGSQSTPPPQKKRN